MVSELAQVSAFHNIDADRINSSVLSEQVAAEIDREILRFEKSCCMATKMGLEMVGEEKLLFGTNAYYSKDWNQTLITK
jgi:hypothetical protein